MNLAKTLTQEEDEYCAFNVVLRPENLPEELKPVCFAQYDPEYEGPLEEIPQAYGKTGFGTLFIKLYYHLTAAAEEMLGEEGLEAIRQGLEQMGMDAARRIKIQAEEQKEKVTKEFVDLNYPLSVEPDKDPLWNLYDGNGAKELLINSFYKIFFRELGL